MGARMGESKDGGEAVAVEQMGGSKVTLRESAGGRRGGPLLGVLC